MNTMPFPVQVAVAVRRLVALTLPMLFALALIDHHTHMTELVNR